MDLNKFQENIEEKLIFWHSNFSFPLKAEMLEEILARILYEKMGINILWKGGSHSPGADIIIIDGESFSVKSGKETNNNIKISSSRTTSYETIKEKINFYKEVENTFSHYFLLSKKENSLKTFIEYTPYIIPKERIKIESLNFLPKSFGWEAESYGYSFKIKRSMSDQIWIDIKKDFINDCALKTISFTIEKKDNGLNVFYKNN